MPSYYRDHRTEGYELVQHLGHELRHSHRPSRYIVNEGKLIIDEHAFNSHHSHHHHHKPNTVIYNAPGSTMWLESSSQRHASSSSYEECRGCFRRRERTYGGYCSSCISARLDRDRRATEIIVDDRRIIEYPERRAIKWR